MPELTISAMKVPPTNIPIGTSVPIKLNHDNFLLWKTQGIPLLEGCGLDTFLYQNPPSKFIINKEGTIVKNKEHEI